MSHFDFEKVKDQTASKKDPKQSFIYASGTGLRRYANSADATYVLSRSYLDLLERKKNGADYYDFLPDVAFYNWRFDQDLIDEFLDLFDENEMFDWSKVYEDIEHAKPVLETLIERLFLEDCKDVRMNKSKINLNRQINNRWGTNQTHRGYMVFANTRRKTHLGQLEDVFNDVLGEDYCIIRLSGPVGSDDSYKDEDGTTNRKAEQEVNQMIEEQFDPKKHKGFIVLSMGMGSRSFSIPEIDTVVFMQDGGNADVNVQKSSRCLTGGDLLNGEQKKHGNVVSLAIDPEQSRKQISDIVYDQIMKTWYRESQLEDREADPEEVFRRVHNTINIFELDETGRQIEITTDEHWKEFWDRDVVSDYVDLSSDYQAILQDPEMAHIIKDSVQDIGFSGSDGRRNNGGNRKLPDPGDKYLDDKENDEDDDHEGEFSEEEWKEIIEKASMLNNASYMIIDMTDNPGEDVETTIDRIIANDADAREFEMLFGISPETYRELINRGHLKTTMLNMVYRRALEDYGIN